MKIPIRNLYFLLVYAWDVLDESHVTDAGAEQINFPPDLFGKLLLNGIDHLLKRGLDRAYRSETHSIPGVRGRIELSESIKQLSFVHGHAVCSYDELTHDIPTNQILKATLRKLVAAVDLDKELKRDLQDLVMRFSDVSDIRITSESFRKIQLHSNNGFYRILIHICQLLHYQLLPEENGAGYQFVDFNEEQMERVFEGFVRNFYKKEQGTYKVKREWFPWQKTYGSADVLAYLPKMETDASLISKSRRIVVETKFYKKTLTSRQNLESSKVHSSNLYQLFAYLQNLNAMDSLPTDGILLYPTMNIELDFDYSSFEHKIKVATVDLNMTNQEIRNRLLALI